MPRSMVQKIFCVNAHHEIKSFQIVQASYRRKFNFNTFQTVATISMHFNTCVPLGVPQGRHQPG